MSTENNECQKYTGNQTQLMLRGKFMDEWATWANGTSLQKVFRPLFGQLLPGESAESVLKIGDAFSETVVKHLPINGVVRNSQLAPFISVLDMNDF